MHMWLHQVGAEGPAAKTWRALDGLRPALARDADAQAALLGVLDASPEELLRERAAELAAFQEAVPALLDALARDSAPRVRAAAATTLGGPAPRRLAAGDGPGPARAGDLSRDAPRARPRAGTGLVKPTAAQLRALARRDPVLGAAMKRVLPFPGFPNAKMQPYQSHYHALARAIVYQQLSGKAAASDPRPGLRP